MLHKLLLALTVGTVSLSTLANDWREIPNTHPNAKVYYDWQSLKEQTYDLSYSENFLYFDINFRLDYKTPQKLKSGKSYTREYHMLSVACGEKQYAKTDFEWYLNKKKIAENMEIPLSASWEDFSIVPKVRILDATKIKQYNFASIQSTSICSELIG